MSVTFHDLATDLAAALTGQTLGGVALVTGTNLFAGMPDYVAPSMAVIILNTGGPAPTPYLSPSKLAITHPSAQVLVHCTAGKPGYTLAQTLILAVMGALQQTAPSGYISLFARESTPTYVSDVDGRGLFTANFEARV